MRFDTLTPPPMLWYYKLMKKLSKKLDSYFTYTILIVIAISFLLWNSIVLFNLEQDVQSIQNTIITIPPKTVIQKDDIEVVEDIRETQETKDSTILYNTDGSIDTSNWERYESSWLEIIFPPQWHFIEMNISGGGFISNKNRNALKFENVNSYIPKIIEGEVRVSISSAPGDLDSNLSRDENFEMEIRNSLNDLVWSCENIDKNSVAYCKQFKDVCSRSEIVQLSDRRYATVQCAYNKKVKDSESEAHTISKELIQRDDSIGTMRTIMQMDSYSKELLDENVFDIIFEQLKRELITFKKVN